MALAPFLGKEMLDQLVNHAAKGNIDWDIIQGLCPFIDRATLSRLVQQESISNPDSGIIVGLAPFLDQSDLAFLSETDSKRTAESEASIRPSTLSAERAASSTRSPFQSSGVRYL